MEGPATSADMLKARVESFLNEGERGREARAMINRLSAIGPVGIFGGMLRDIARMGTEGFESDIDLVIDGPSRLLPEVLTGETAERNRFGGYRVYCQHGQFDIWTLQDTWAIKEGFISASSLADLTKTTFLDWDAAVYLPHYKTLYCSDDYLHRLHSDIVSINFEPNPNPLGAVARTLRILVDWEASLSEHLVEYLWRHLSLHDKSHVVKAQITTIGRVRLKSNSIRKLHRELSKRDLFDRTFRHQRKRTPRMP